MPCILRAERICFMRRIFLIPLCAALLFLCAGCGQEPITAPVSSAASSAGTQSAPAQNAAPAPAQHEASSAVDNLNPAPGAVIVESQDCYDDAFCFQPGESGTYHFCAQTADAFLGSEVGYPGDTITWTIYVLDEPFSDTWRMLDQAAHSVVSDLSGSTDLPLRAGQYVYCVCSLNSFTCDPAPDGSGALSITFTGTDYAPSASNNYQLAITVGSEGHIDLDGDGNEDVIYYSVLPDQQDTSGVWTGAKPESLSIDGTEFLSSGQENPTAAYGFWMDNPEADYYYIVDLDAKDGLREVAIPDLASNGETVTHYFRYSDGQLTDLGPISGLPSDHATVFHGDGTVSAMTPLDLLQNWSGVRTYALSDGRLHRVEGAFFTPQLPDGRDITLLQSLTVYAQLDQTSQQLVLTPSSFPLSFPLTDGQNWLEIRCADGSSGWAYFSDFNTVISGDKELEASAVFGNLLLTG